jgi:hypothetical protein
VQRIIATASSPGCVLVRPSTCDLLAVPRAALEVARYPAAYSGASIDGCLRLGLRRTT